MKKKLIQEKSLLNHYPKEPKNTESESQKIRSEKSEWKRTTIRINEEYDHILRVEAVKNKMKLEDLFNDMIEEYLKQKGLK